MMATARITTRLAAVAIRTTRLFTAAPLRIRGIRRRTPFDGRRIRRRDGRRRQFTGRGAQGGRSRWRPTGRWRGQGLTVRVAASRAGQRQAGRTAPLIAVVAGDRVGQRQMRLPALPGAREGHRQRGGAGLADARLDEVRRQHRVGIKTQVGERGVDERLGELSRCEVHHRRLEERTGAQHLAERHRVAPKEIERALQFLLSVVQNLQDTVEFVQRRLELRSVVVHQPGYLM